MSTRSVELERRAAWVPLDKSKQYDEAALRDMAARAESLQKKGTRMVIAGFVITIVGVVLYCAVTFAGGMSAGMSDILLRNSVPFARVTLGILGFGTLVWLVGSFTYLRGAMDAEEELGEEGGPSQP